MMIAQPIELLAPAKDLLCGKEAVLHGADAVYIGAPKFGARAAAGNSLDDIRALCDFAHIYNVKIYVALNTILRDEELADAERMIHRLYDVGADALIVQDMGITRLDIPPIPLHASTQMDNCTPEKVAFLGRAGFEQVVLARELTLEEIRKIAAHVPNVTLEAFVHGALCVSYSGRCYLSQALTGRSANRGACAQCCRLPYTMVDADGTTIASGKHLLSLRDMNRSDDLEAMMHAGVTSFKIEGRLKDMSYVKNITAFYRRRLDAIMAKHPKFFRASAGRSSFTFEPRPEKSFNRGFTGYFLHGREAEITSFDTPKSIGEPVGTVKDVQGRSLTVSGLKPLHNGDGLVFLNARGELEGFRVNRTEAHRVFPAQMPSVKSKTVLYRNFDHDFEAMLAKPSAERKIKVTMEWSDCLAGFALTITDETDACVTVVRPFAHEPARKPQSDNIRVQLSKLGGTPFEAQDVTVTMRENYFVPSSLLSEMRREAVEKLLAVRRIRYPRRYAKRPAGDETVAFPSATLDYTANIYNAQAEAFYRRHGVQQLERAYEEKPLDGVPLMYTKHCLRYSMGWCPVHHKRKSPYREPFYLKYKETSLRLEFDCRRCEMRLLLTPSASPETS